MTPQARSGAQFELRRFEALPASGAVVVLLLEGRFKQSTRFGRPPVLVIEPGEDERRVELTPIRTVADGHRWEAAYAAPAEALTTGARLALGVRGTLLELPSPDEPDDGQRLTALAREANRLRRAIETAEDDATTARTELGAAVAAARDQALAESTERISALERDLAEAHRVAAADAEQSKAAALAAGERATAAETRLTETTEALRAAEERATAAEAAAAESAAATTAAETLAAESGAAAAAAEQRAAEASAAATAAEERAAAAEARVAEPAAAADTAGADAPLTAEAASLVDAQARASDAERELRVAREGIEVLRAELVEERERSQVTVAELEQRLDAAHARTDALRHAAAAEGVWPETGDHLAEGVAPADDAETEVSANGLDPTRPFTVAEQRDADDDATQPFGDTPRRAPREATLRDLVTPPDVTDKPAGPNPGRWIALAALVLFAFVLLGLLLGFLA